MPSFDAHATARGAVTPQLKYTLKQFYRHIPNRPEEKRKATWNARDYTTELRGCATADGRNATSTDEVPAARER